MSNSGKKKTVSKALTCVRRGLGDAYPFPRAHNHSESTFYSFLLTHDDMKDK